MPVELILLLIGLLGLWFSSGIVVENTKKIASYMGISQTLIGLSVISIGTSLPEIATSILAGIDVTKGIDASGIVVGTNIGSGLAQITLIMGITVVIGGKLKASKRVLKRDGTMVLIAIVLMFLVGLTGLKILRIEGIVLIGMYIVYLYYISKNEEVGKKIRKEFSKDNEHDGSRYRSLKICLFMVMGIVVLIIASHLVVNNAILLAEQMNWAKSFVAVMIIGVGTGLPELTTAIRAIKEKAGDISIGTLLGSNITDPMFSLATGAIAASSFGLIVDKNLLYFDIPFWFMSTLIALHMFGKKKFLSPKNGMILIGIYVIFAFIKFSYFR